MFTCWKCIEYVSLKCSENIVDLFPSLWWLFDRFPELHTMSANFQTVFDSPNETSCGCTYSSVFQMPSITVLCFQARYPGLKPLCDLGQVIHSSYPSVSRAGDERIKCRDFGAKSQGSCCCPLPLWKWHLSFFIWETDHRRLRCCSHYCPGLLLSGCSADLVGLLQALQRVCCCGQAELGQPQPGCLPCASTLRSHSQWVMSPRDPDVEVGRLSSKW